MERPRAALLAVDHANRLLRVGQLLFYPGPPPEFAFYAALPWSQADVALLTSWLPAVLREAESAGHVAVSSVRGFHPADLTALWQRWAEEAEQSAAVEGATTEPDAAPAIAAVKRRRRPRNKTGGNSQGEG
jgi:hypothetical protein